MRPLFILLPALLVAGCVSSAQVARDARSTDDAQCRSYGVGSPAYVRCRTNLDNQRATVTGAIIANGGLFHH